MEKNISFQVFAFPHINKKAENSPKNGLLTVSLKRIFPGMPKRFSGCAIQGSDYKNSLKPVQRTDLKLFFMVRGRGLEPLRITPLEPKSSASAISPPAREIDQERNAETADSKVSQIMNMEEKPLMSKISFTFGWSENRTMRPAFC